MTVSISYTTEKNVGMGVEHSWQVTSREWMTNNLFAGSNNWNRNPHEPATFEPDFLVGDLFFRYKKCSSTVVRCLYQNQLQNMQNSLASWKTIQLHHLQFFCFLLNSFCSLYPRAMLVTEIGGVGPQMKLFSTSHFILFSSHVSQHSRTLGVKRGWRLEHEIPLYLEPKGCQGMSMFEHVGPWGPSI